MKDLSNQWYLVRPGALESIETSIDMRGTNARNMHKEALRQRNLIYSSIILSTFGAIQYLKNQGTTNQDIVFMSVVVIGLGASMFGMFNLNKVGISLNRLANPPRAVARKHHPLMLG